MLRFLVELGGAFTCVGGVLGFIGFAVYVAYRFLTVRISIFSLLEPLFFLGAYLIVPTAVAAYFADLLAERLLVIPFIPNMRVYAGWLGATCGFVVGVKLYRWFR